MGAISRKFYTSYFWIALLISACMLLADHPIIPGQGTWNILELRTIDFRFFFKGKPEEDAAKRIALIVIDEKSYKGINEPLVFYHTHICRVIDYLVKSGAKVIGMDIQLPSISLEQKVSGGYESVYTRTLLAARREGVNVVIGFYSPQTAPLQTYLAAVGRDNLATFGLTADADDFIRRQQLYFSNKGQTYDSFAYLLAKKSEGRSLNRTDKVVLIDYTLLRGIPIYSFKDIYDSSIQQPHQEGESPFKGKTVIIGALLSLEDRHATPLGSSILKDKNKRTPGVLIHAAALNTLLSGVSFREPGRLAGAFFILIASVLAVFLCHNRRPFSAALFCAFELVVILAVSILAFDHLYVIHLIPLLSAVVLSFVGTTVFHYYREERGRKKIRERFASYVPERIIEQIVDAGIEELTQGERREVALLFCDIRGFTPYSEKNKAEPRKIVNFLNHYHKEMTEIILNNNGTVSQLTGDGIFAFFGAPVNLDNSVAAAVKSALEMKEKVAELRPRWREYGMDDMRIGIGIHFGESIVGNIGSVKKMAYVAIGDNTNVASRIEGLTNDMQETILLSGAAYLQVKDMVNARPRGPAKIKGHSEVEVFALDGLDNGHVRAVAHE